MFFTLALISALSYAFQGSLLSKYSRTIGGPSASLYRGLSLIISTSVLTPFIPTEAWGEIKAHILPLLAMGFCSGMSSLVAYSSWQYAPIGVSNSVRMSITIIASIILSFVFFQEVLSNIQGFLITLIALSVIILGISKKDFEHLDTKKFSLGMLLAILAGLFTALSFFFVTDISRQIDPLLVSYLLQVLSALWILVILVCFKRKSIQKISKKTFLDILIKSFPTVLAIVTFTYAAVLGPFNILSSVQAIIPVVVALMGVVLHKEHLKSSQWLAIILAFIAIVGLKLFTS